MTVGSWQLWQLAVGSWQLAVGSWQLAVGSWQLAVVAVGSCGSWQLAIGNWLLTVGSWRVQQKPGSNCLRSDAALLTFFTRKKKRKKRPKGQSRDRTRRVSSLYRDFIVYMDYKYLHRLLANIGCIRKETIYFYRP